MAMSVQEVNKQVVSEKIERVLMMGDLKTLTAEERVEYHNLVCKSIGLNPLTRPLEYITLNGKLVLYARKDCTEQLRKLHNVSIVRLETETNDGVFEAMAYAKSGEREDIDFGAVSIKGLQGDALVNAKLKAITKAKRRVTLSICGLGFLDETEVETVPDAKPETSAGSSAFTTLGMITSDQKYRLKSLTENLAEFEIPAAHLQKKMVADFNVQRSAELTEEQAEKFIADLYDWLNGLEESRAENIKEAVDVAQGKKQVPF